MDGFIFKEKCTDFFFSTYVKLQMSFDFTNVKKKADLAVPVAPHATPAPTPNEAQFYQARKDRVMAQLTNRLASTNDLPFSIRVGFLTDDDKNALTTGLTGLGYTCAVNNNMLTIQ